MSPNSFNGGVFLLDAPISTGVWNGESRWLMAEDGVTYPVIIRPITWDYRRFWIRERPQLGRKYLHRLIN